MRASPIHALSIASALVLTLAGCSASPMGTGKEQLRDFSTCRQWTAATRHEDQRYVRAVGHGQLDGPTVERIASETTDACQSSVYETGTARKDALLPTVRLFIRYPPPKLNAP